jgi:ArsR family transcriptional regulator
MKTNNTCLRQGKLKPESLEKAAATLKMLAHPQRLRLIEILECEDEMPVNGLVEETGFPQAVVSQHLNLMRRSGLLSATRYGKQMCYRIIDPRPLSILNCICTHCSQGDYEEI